MLMVEDVDLTPNPHALKFILNKIESVSFLFKKPTFSIFKFNFNPFYILNPKDFLNIFQNIRILYLFF